MLDAFRGAWRSRISFPRSDSSVDRYAISSPHSERTPSPDECESFERCRSRFALASCFYPNIKSQQSQEQLRKELSLRNRQTILATPSLDIRTSHRIPIHPEPYNQIMILGYRKVVQQIIQCSDILWLVLFVVHTLILTRKTRRVKG